ncbi:hypothetical protein SeMB42_g06793 [Synchytrium endobioticum]|uniref:Major facilitator superfamily (MFS) profile domain-containing protein n=1 Tax=Synchytrium endobioticum TaxID=286115 RepID=A0A507CIH1_9FUNG|nr:hypothetical protein SeMB42_g06793 [Synchytrium endobioticum]
MFFVNAVNGAQVALLHGWVANNHRTAGGRGFAMGLMNGLGSVSGAIGGQIYRTPDAPHYPMGNGTNAAILLSGVFMTLVVRISFIFKNGAIDRRNKNLAESGIELTEDQLFKYTL